MTTVSSFAQDDLDYSSMDLEDLLNVEVSVSSSSAEAEKIIETPAIVSRFNRADLEKMGIRDIKGLISFFPGFISVEAGIATSPTVIRGIGDAFDQKSLFCLDGVPIYQSSHSISGLLGVPFEAISHIEVIRGPGAVIYGTNASAGVINVVTKTDDNSVVAIEGGSNSRFNGSGYLSKNWGEDMNLSLSFETQSDDGYDAHYENTPAPPFFNPVPATGGDIVKAEEYTNFLVKFRYKTFNAFLQFQEDDRDGLAGVGTIENTTTLEDKGNTIHLDYTWSNDTTSVKFYTDRNRLALELPLERANGAGFVNAGGFRFSNDGDDNWRWRTGIHSNFKINDSFTIFAGGEFETRSSGEYQSFLASTGQTLAVLMEAREIDETSLFAQGDFKSSDGKWRFLLGARYTDNENAGENVNPRASLVYKIDDTQSIKFLYSEGFNSPNFLQNFINLPNVIVGDPNLEAEIVTDIDIAYSYNEGNTLFVANLYYLETENFIGRGGRPGQLGNFYFNTDGFDRTGLELDYQRAMGSAKIFANLAYQDEGNEVIEGDVTALFAPQLTAVLGYSRRFGAADANNHNFGGSIRYIGERGVADAQTLVNLNYEFKMEHFRFYVTGRNLLDEDRVNPDYQDFVVNREIPGGDGVNFLVGLKGTF